MPLPLKIAEANAVPVVLFPLTLALSPLKITVPPFASKVVVRKSTSEANVVVSFEAVRLPLLPE